jgi:hypothetical protein
MPGLRILIALLFLSAWSSTPAGEGDDLERATQACATGAFAFTMVAEKLAYDIDVVESDQGREAFLAEVESLDKQRHEMPTFKAIWLLSLSDALAWLRHELANFDSVAHDEAAQGKNVSAARMKQLRAGTWNYASNKLADVCMFRAGKLSGQGKL